MRRAYPDNRPHSFLLIAYYMKYHIILSTKSDPAHGVETTHQTWISGCDILREYFGEEIKGGDETNYKPVLAIFVNQSYLTSTQ